MLLEVLEYQSDDYKWFSNPNTANDGTKKMCFLESIKEIYTSLTENFWDDSRRFLEGVQSFPRKIRGSFDWKLAKTLHLLRGKWVHEVKNTIHCLKLSGSSKPINYLLDSWPVK